MTPLTALINQEIEDFKSKDIQIVPGYYFNQKSMIERVYLYFNSKYATGEIDDEGDRKYFYNIVRNPCKVFSKAVDFDTKNIRLLTTSGGNSMKTWYMERDLRYWMKKENFGSVLNKVFEELPKFGSVVLKIVNNKPKLVDLRNFFCSQTADTLDDAVFITEIHPYNVSQFRKAAKKMNWENVEEAIDKFREMKDTDYINVYERYGEIEENGEYKYKRVFIADVGKDEYDQATGQLVSSRGVELKQDEVDKHPYWEFHKEKILGRWLGVGVVEELIEPQIRNNEIANLQAKTSYWAALRIFQTRDAGVNRNLYTDVQTGEILTVDSEITQVDMSDRNLAFFNQEYVKWLKNRDELSFSYDVVQGERLPAGTPLGSARMAISQAMSYFQQVQQNIAMTVKKMLFDVVIPDFQRISTREHTLRLVGKDLDNYVNLIKDEMVNIEITKQLLKHSLGKVPFPMEKDKEIIGLALEERIKRGNEQLIDIPKDFYKDIKYDIEIDIVGESEDTRVKNATMFAILQAITADPTITTDPAKRNILFALAEGGGLNPNDLFPAETSSPMSVQPEMSRAGGGVSRPDMSSLVGGEMEETL